MIDTNRYYDAMSSLINAPNEELTPAKFALLNAAQDVDVLTRQVTEDCRSMAERFTRFAAELDEGLCYGTPPTASSAVYDISAGAARLEQRRADLLSLIGATLGREARKAFVDALNRK
jgi:hypothetical protein